jgi:Spy/CpxP family protein refolding chaperone
MEKQRVTILVLALFMVLAGVAVAQAGMHGMGPWPVPLQALRDLDLSNAQKAKVAKIVKAGEEAARLKMQKVRDILDPVLKAEEFNEENIRSAFRQASPLMEDEMVMHMKMKNEILAVLTSDQRQQLLWQEMWNTHPFSRGPSLPPIPPSR